MNLPDGTPLISSDKPAPKKDPRDSKLSATASKVNQRRSTIKQNLVVKLKPRTFQTGSWLRMLAAMAAIMIVPLQLFLSGYVRT